MSSARRDLESAEKFIRGESARFNSLGILQSGPAIDRLAGLFDVYVDQAVSAEFDILVAALRSRLIFSRLPKRRAGDAGPSCFCGRVRLGDGAQLRA